MGLSKAALVNHKQILFLGYHDTTGYLFEIKSSLGLLCNLFISHVHACRASCIDMSVVLF